MQDGDQDHGPPPPPAWMKRDEPYKLRRDPELPREILKTHTDTSPSSQEDCGDGREKGAHRSPSHSGWQSLLGRDLPLETETVVYIFISALDLFVTWMMLRSDVFRERNPVARYFLDHWGPKGMIYYKFTIVAIVTMAAQGIALRKPDTARFVLILGSVVTGGVVVYSVALFLRGVLS